VQPYTKRFFQDITEGSRRSAREIVPLVLELVRPRSVIDVGCGVGTWLSVFREHGMDDVLGVDGEYVDRSRLEIPEDRFLPSDLREPLRVDGWFDLVVSLEVAEHLPEERADAFVDTLTGLGPVVLFSAAIPFQGGTHHLNEQWPEYWERRFRRKGYVAVDCLRRKVWLNENVEWWYAQNALVFVARERLGDWPLLKREYELAGTSQLPVVHPKKYMEMIEWMRGLYSTAQDIAAAIPPGETLILVDEDQLGSVATAGYRTVPFLECDGRYWGPPPDDESAIRELERLRRDGATFMVFAWPALWWLDHYSGLRRYLRSEFRYVLESDRLVVLDLRPRGEAFQPGVNGPGS